MQCSSTTPPALCPYCGYSSGFLNIHVLDSIGFHLSKQSLWISWRNDLKICFQINYKVLNLRSNVRPSIKFLFLQKNAEFTALVLKRNRDAEIHSILRQQDLRMLKTQFKGSKKYDLPQTLTELEWFNFRNSGKRGWASGFCRSTKSKFGFIQFEKTSYSWSINKSGLLLDIHF